MYSIISSFLHDHREEMFGDQSLKACIIKIEYVLINGQLFKYVLEYTLIQNAF